MISDKEINCLKEKYLLFLFDKGNQKNEHYSIKTFYIIKCPF